MNGNETEIVKDVNEGDSVDVGVESHPHKDDPIIPALSSTEESSSSRENSEEPTTNGGPVVVVPEKVERSETQSSTNTVEKEPKVEHKIKKTAKKDLLKAKKKEDKGIEHVLKALSSLNSPEEKLAALCKKYTDLLEDHRLNMGSHKQGQRSLQVLMREKDQLQTEHTKALLAKSKMENLCRELQKHNKLIKEESVARAKVEEEKRKDVTNKFQTTINDIQTQMNDHYTNNSRLKEENIELASKLKKLIEQYEKTEKHMDKLFKTNKSLTEDKENSLKERQLLLKELQHSATKCLTMEATEIQLKNQLAIYTEKYEDFQSTLKKSNEVFNGFKGEMEKMTKKIKKLEKDTTMWKTRWEQSQKALIDMVEEKTQSERKMSTLQLKINKLEKLCRALQAERNSKSGSSSPKAATPEQTPENSITRSVPDTTTKPEETANVVQDSCEKTADLSESATTKPKETANVVQDADVSESSTTKPEVTANVVQDSREKTAVLSESASQQSPISENHEPVVTSTSNDKVEQESAGEELSPQTE